MPLVLDCQSETTLPIEVEEITFENLAGLSNKNIAKQKIWHGRKRLQLGELFSVTGKIDADDPRILWRGNLSCVHWIGAHLAGGTMVIESASGRHVGSEMTSGTILAKSDVGDFLGSEMTGGLIKVAGDAGDRVGGNLPGSKVGMNRGSILIDGNVGFAMGQGMRRGTIAVGGDAGPLCGWNMLAGSLLVFGTCGPEFGANMKRGTIVLAGTTAARPSPTFTRGGSYQNFMLPMLAQWLLDQQFHPAEHLLNASFQMYHGDLLRGGRGEVLLRKD